jgi:hypothetical protein
MLPMCTQIKQQIHRANTADDKLDTNGKTTAGKECVCIYVCVCVSIYIYIYILWLPISVLFNNSIICIDIDACLRIVIRQF